MVDWIMTCVRSATFSIRLNRDIVGYFKSKKGLRQGDLISLYVFTLVMEVFSLIMAKNFKENKSFKYHKGCKELKITHLSCADDLLGLSHGDLNFVSVIKEALEEFIEVSGLNPSIGKSIVFFSNVDVGKKKRSWIFCLYKLEDFV
ncbi:RNA-directed DNA polymerase, eukaryota, reverse transcriptase zinc-binding domain protein [Tanacetum coccineum]|uniref:RNA-directed DNA polymerase, eukaryota, reverse transcriptase zinc-binding domain protein n=1 Tax=Tanacetum coccineum TaxID=301880 RepID=A0ABQ5EGU0_9ASTR